MPSALIALQIGAAESPEGHFEFTVFGATITITGYKGPGGDVVIPSTINLLPVTRIAGFAFVDEIGLTSVIIPDSVTSIEYRAFANCTSLTSIDVDAFNMTYSSVDGVLFDKSQTTLILCPPGRSGHYSIPESVTTIGDYAFSGCTGPTSVGCTGLTSVYFKGLPPRVGDFVFECADNVTVYYLPGTEGWSSAFGGRRTALWILPPRILTESGRLGVKPEGFTFTISWGTEEPIVVEAITDLSGSDWVTLYSGTVTGGSVEITDPDWHQHRARFYRARVMD